MTDSIGRGIMALLIVTIVFVATLGCVVVVARNDVIDALKSSPRVTDPVDYVVLRWSDVPNEYVVHRAIDTMTGRAESDAVFAARIIETDAKMHRAFLQMRGQ